VPPLPLLAAIVPGRHNDGVDVIPGWLPSERRLTIATTLPRAQQLQRRAAPRRETRRRALFYSHDVFGLGHMRSTLTIVSELARLRREAALLALTGSFQTDAWELPSNFDYIKLPTMTKRQLYTGLPERAGAPGAFANHSFLREAVIEGVVDAFEPQLVFVENAPAGLDRELARALACLRAAAPRVTLVAGLGDIIDDARSTIDWWRRDGVYELLEDVYDHILIYGDQRVYDPLVEYQFTPAMAAKTEFCGYLTRADPLRSPDEVRAELGA
jgi:predicted glycosyltransferase